MKQSKVTQSDLDKFVPAVLFQEQSEQDTQAEREQRENEQTSKYMQRTETKDPITASQAESICEKMLIVREYNDKLPF